MSSRQLLLIQTLIHRCRAKYPLAIISKILDTHGNDTLGGYDIGCSAETTVKSSSLGPRFIAQNARFCVNAFHGYTHSYACQLQYHPNIIDGMGIEDLETLERVFSATNRLAPITRYASPFRRRLLIETYLKQWDEDKYANLGDFLLNNYKQALDIINSDGFTLDQAMKTHAVTADLIDKWSKEEFEYFATLGTEPEYNIHAITYVELLQDLRELENRRFRATTSFVAFAPEDGPSSYVQDTSKTRQLETERRHAVERYERVNLDVCSLEVQMGITERWTPVTPEYQDAVKYVRERKYHRALNKLQRLVVQRLFELQKLNVSQTGAYSHSRAVKLTKASLVGYKMRMHIAKSLQVRCKTIKKAVVAYNTAAAALDPPKPALDWADVSRYSFLEQFTLLQDTRNETQSKPWCAPVISQVIKLYRRVARAKEELVRLDVEVRRLHTAIRDDWQLFKGKLASLDPGNPLHGALRAFATRRQAIDRRILKRIGQVYALPGFTGIAAAGTRLGSNTAMQTDETTEAVDPAGPGDLDHELNVEEDGGDVDDDADSADDGDAAHEQASAYIEYISELATS